MRIRPGLKDPRSGRGFSLIELLLAVVLILLFLGALIFNFSSLQKGAELDQGAEQVEALLRFARAHAASTGKKVQIWFEEDAGDGLRIPLGNLQMMSEPEPLADPGRFEVVGEAKPYVERILDLVQVDDVWLNSGSEVAGSSQGSALAPADQGEEELMMVTFPPFTFYPDGSSDSGHIVLSSRRDEDDRQMVVRLEGIGGITRREVLLPAEEITEEELARIEETLPKDATP